MQNLARTASLLAFVSAVSMAAETGMLGTQGLRGVDQVQSAKTLGTGRFVLGGSGKVAGGSSLLAHDSVMTSTGPKDVSQVVMAEAFLSFGLGVTRNADIALNVPLEYESIEGLDETKGVGDISLTGKFRLPLSQKENPFDLAVLFAVQGGTSSVSDGGLIPRRFEYLDPTDNTSTRTSAFGSQEIEVTGALLGTVDVGQTKAAIPLLFHVNGGYRQVLKDHLGLGYISAAAEWYPLPILGLNASGWMEFPNEYPKWMGREQKVSQKQVSVGGVFRPTPTLEFAGQVSLGLQGDDYVKGLYNKDKKWAYSAHTVPPVQVGGSITWTGFLIAQDQDKDGIIDKEDRCPNEPEDQDRFEDEDGCPDLDNDADGIPDSIDQCINEAEDKDGFQDQDGCPDKDNDQDGIVDDKDQCINEAEDKDGFQDQDGCPDFDNDSDGIPDSTDKCPNAAEVRNSFEDEDGCPDIAPAPAAAPTPPPAPAMPPMPERMVLRGITFRTGTAELTFESRATMDSIAMQMKTFPDAQIVIEGHTDNVGKPATNMKLSQDRAQSVLDYLVSQGVPEGRMQAKGYGQDRPVANNKTAAGRAENRRIEIYRTK